jgi:rubrerythrin
MSIDEMPDNDMRGKWRCSDCGRVNSMDRDNVCPNCLPPDEDDDALAAVKPEN